MIFVIFEGKSTIILMYESYFNIGLINPTIPDIETNR